MTGSYTLFGCREPKQKFILGFFPLSPNGREKQHNETNDEKNKTKTHEQFNHKQQERAGVSKMNTKLFHEQFNTKEHRTSTADNRLLFSFEKFQMHFFVCIFIVVVAVVFVCK